MNISYRWLSDYLPQQISPDELSLLLTEIGLEVEEVSRYESIRGGLEGLVVGKVERIEAIPKSDKIRLTHVRISEHQVLQIVCGASNVKEGALVIVALPETTLYPQGGEPFTIQPAKIRGVKSFGMLCSKKEIGLSDEHEGIIILENDMPIGTRAKEVFDIYTDVIFKINLTANRNDCMSHLGVARDICAYWSYHQNKLVSVVEPKTLSIPLAASSTSFNIQIESKACERYSMMMVDEVKISDSPLWMRHRLEAIGQSSISNLVDATNYILHELGQPLHAFDKTAITGNTVVVKQGLDIEFETLDGKKRQLYPEDLMICNAQEPMCIAGVFGGKKSSIQTQTRQVAFESAHFDAPTIRRTSMRHQLRTEAASRFEKQVDADGTIFALQRLAYLLKEMGFDKVLPIMDVRTKHKKRKIILFSFSFLERLAGKIYDDERVEKLFQALSFSIVGKKLNSNQIEWEISPPAYRTDIEHPADLVEEVVRIDGLNQIPIPVASRIPYQFTPFVNMQSLKRQLSHLICGMGFYETIHNSIVNEKWFKKNNQTIFLINSLSIDHTQLRTHMMPAGLESILYNIHRKKKDIKFFEFGKIYFQMPQGEFVEKNKIGFWITGLWENESWLNPKGKASAWWNIVGLVESLADYFSLEKIKSESHPNEEKESTYFNHTMFFSHPFIQGKNAWAFIAEVDEQYLKIRAIKQKVFYAEIDLDQVLSFLSKQNITYQEPSKFHDVTRDIAFYIDNHVTYQEIKDGLLNLQLPFLYKIDLFDVFQDESGHRSMAIRCSLRAKDKTLTDSQTQGEMDAVMRCLEYKFSAKIRRSS